LKQLSYALFDTPLGSCGIAWREGTGPAAPYAVAFFQLPESTLEHTASRIAKSCGVTKPSAPPEQIAHIIFRVRKHLDGDIQNFRDVPVDLNSAGPFVQRVCEAARDIPMGKTVTYADLAGSFGRPSLARAVGRALGRNPIPLIIPCHRVMAAHGKPGGFSAYGGRATKAKLLALEGAVVNLCLDLSTGL